MKAVKLPILLEGDTPVAWLDLTKEQQSDYLVTVDKLKSKLALIGFSSLEAFVTTWRSIITFSTRFETKVSRSSAME